jgi:hypothetical protein
MGPRAAVLGTLAAIGVAVFGYHMGTMGGLAVMALGALIFWFVVQATAWSIPTIGDVMNRPREDGIQVPVDLREQDPDLRMSQSFWNSLDRDPRQ